MAQIVINEISQNYTYNIGANSFATVAMPLTACWGPGFFDPESEGTDVEGMLEYTAWQRFPATQTGLESFVSTYRGAASNYRLANDYSYQMAMTLLTAGYDVLVCRVCPGGRAEGTFSAGEGKTLTVKAKYPGSFGNNLRVELKKLTYRKPSNGEIAYYWNIITYIVDSSGIKASVENKTFVFELDNSTDSILHWSEVESDFLTLAVTGNISDKDDVFTNSADSNKKYIDLVGGSDRALADDSKDASVLMDDAIALATSRFKAVGLTGDTYIGALQTAKAGDIDKTRAGTIKYLEWIYTMAVGQVVGSSQYEGIYDLLKDKLTYNPNRVISPGWDDQNLWDIAEDDSLKITELSPLHIKIMDVAYYSRCATGFIDIPKSMKRKDVYNESEVVAEYGYAQKLARYMPENAAMDVNGTLYQSHSALFAPWGQYQYVGTGKKATASPSFQALMIMRAQILNQALQYEWALPTNRKHNLRLGKLDYNVPKKILDVWQTLEGVGVNVITSIPDLGTNIWGNSTLFEVPPATYQALANLSTRFLVNAVEDIAYRVGIGITFQYNNEQAYNKFYAGVTPILDTMKNVGAIDDYYVRMSADINALDQVNANTIIGKIYLVINGVVNDIFIDLIALPPGTDLNQFKS